MDLEFIESVLKDGWRVRTKDGRVYQNLSEYKENQTIKGDRATIVEIFNQKGGLSMSDLGFTKSDLKDGWRIKTQCGRIYELQELKVTHEDGGWNYLKDYNEDLTYNSLINNTKERLRVVEVIPPEAYVKPFTKEDLKTGMIVVNRIGTKYWVMLDTSKGDILKSKDAYMPLFRYDSNLQNTGARDFDIVKVIGVSGFGADIEWLADRGKVLFERNDKNIAVKEKVCYEYSCPSCGSVYCDGVKPESRGFYLCSTCGYKSIFK